MFHNAHLVHSGEDLELALTSQIWTLYFAVFFFIVSKLVAFVFQDEPEVCSKVGYKPSRFLFPFYRKAIIEALVRAMV